MEISDLQSWLSVIVPIVAVIIPVTVAIIEHRKRKHSDNVLEQMLKAMKSTNEELELLRKQAREGQLSNTDIRRQEMLQRQGQQQWRETVHMIKDMAELAKIAKQLEMLDEEED